MNIEGLKKELQGNGIVKEVRNELLNDTKMMAELAFDKVEKEIGHKIGKDDIINDVDGFLKKLLIAETEIYKNKAPQILKEVIPYYYNKYYNKEDKYENMFELVEGLEDVYNNIQDYKFGEFITQVCNILSEPMDIICFSQRQSAKSRVGESLQNHLGKIFDIIGTDYEVQLQLDSGGTIMDFIIPSKEKVNMEPSQTINIECQTTLKDRFRLTTGKLTVEHVKKYLATATGCGLINTKDKNDLSIEKVKEIISDNNTTLVVFKEVKDNIVNQIEMYKQNIDSEGKGLRKRKGKIMLTSAECEKLLTLAKNKIITYDNLILRDINSINQYWNS